MWFFRRKKKQVRASEFILEDDDGRERARMEMDTADNAVLSFKAPDGTTRLFMGVTPEGTPRVCLSYADGRGSIQLEANDRLKSAALVVTGPNGKAQVMLGIAADGSPVLMLLDAEGNVLYQSVVKDGESGGPDTGYSFDWDSLLRQ
jgi:hypothetical protein